MAAPAGGAHFSKRVLHVYRQLLHVAKRSGAIEEELRVRQGFREYASATDVDTIEKAVQRAESRLGYLRMVSPHLLRRDGYAQRGATTTVYRKGEALEGAEANKRSRARHSNWTGSNLDPDSVARHNAMLKKARFRNNAHAIGPQGF